jgi:hypothetical protein
MNGNRCHSLDSGIWIDSELLVFHLDQGWGFPIGCLCVDVVVARLLEREEIWEG